jgi:manganese/zinc/iron transport system ATP- binding protein
MNKQNSPSLPALYISQLNVYYGETAALWDISLQVPPGKLVGIIGPNGAGKTTLMKAVLKLIPGISGKVELFGNPLKKVRLRVAYMPQRQSVDWNFPMTVQDLVLMGCYGRLGLFRWPGQKERHAAAHYLEKVGMLPYAKRQISQLSGGQQQRAFLARALAQEADLYFMDEPFAGVDLATEAAIVSILKELKQQGKTIFIIHHDLNTVENYFDWMIALNVRLVGCGPVKELFNAATLYATYGKSHALFDEALKLSQRTATGTHVS